MPAGRRPKIMSCALSAILVLGVWARCAVSFKRAIVYGLQISISVRELT